MPSGNHHRHAHAKVFDAVSDHVDAQGGLAQVELENLTPEDFHA